MNVVICNKNKNVLDNLNIEVIKRLEGEYSVDDLLEIFKNLFYNKLVVDITALKDCSNINVIQRFAASFDLSRMVLFLSPDSSFSSPDFISNLEGVTYLLNHPNSYSNVAQYHKIDSMLLDVEPEVEINNFEENTNSLDANPEVSVQNSIDVSNDNEEADEVIQPSGKTIIIGIKSVTPGAGSTTLTYLLKKHLEKKYRVLAVEVEKRDFSYFNDKTLLSSANGVVGQILSTNKDKDVILVDLNGSNSAVNFCDVVIYLIEPSIIKINRLLSIKPKILNELKGKKVVLCPSLLSNKDVRDFEYESGLKVFYNLKPVDDHSSSDDIRGLLRKLGFNKIK